MGSSSSRPLPPPSNRVLSTQLPEPAKFAQRLFVCGICLEEMPDDSIARPDHCGHTFCRACLRGHVAVRINERRFPILCPSCTANQGNGNGVAGGMYRERMLIHLLSSHIMFPLEVSQAVALDLGLTDEQYRIWTEMEMVTFSVRLSCRKYVRIIHPHRSSANG